MEEYKIKENKSLINRIKNAKRKKKNKNILIKNLNIKMTPERGKNIKIVTKIKTFHTKRRYLFCFGLIIIVFLLLFLIHKKIFKKKEKSEEIEISNFNKIILNKTIEKDINEEYKDIQNYMDLVLNGTMIDKDKTYPLSKNPLISIVISVYNGEAFLRTILLSIQNQDFKDIEIVMVDDCSKDNSVNLIKELMKTEPRIVLYENQENKGALYSKTRGVLLAKGKYVMILDEDDFYSQRDAFSCLYSEAEKNNLDFLGFLARHSGTRIARKDETFGDKKRIITQPELSNLMYYPSSDGRIHRFAGVMADLFIKTSVLQKAIRKIDEKNLNSHMICHDDFILFFLLTRTAYSAKYVDRLFYIWFDAWSYVNSNEKLRNRNQIKGDNLYNKNCFSYINFLEIIFKTTKNTVEDKKIAFTELENWYLNNNCRNNKDTREKAIEVFKLYLESEFIKEEDKDKIRKFIDNK